MQDSCHLRHAQRLPLSSAVSLRRIPGLRVVEPAEQDICCGSAGIYNITGVINFAQGDMAMIAAMVAISLVAEMYRPALLAAAGKDETVRLGFGADDKIKIERSVLKRNEGSAGLLVTTSKTDERSFKTTVRNGHDFAIRIAIETTTSAGWTAETIRRASMTNGLNGGRNDARVTHAPPPPPSAMIAVR